MKFFCLRSLLLLSGVLLLYSAAKAVGEPIGVPTPRPAAVSKSSTTSDVQVATTPIGSPYYRFLADDFDISIKELVKFERKGFGRIEMVEIILIANSEDKTIKELGNRRIKDHVSMETLAKEAGLNYRELAKVARDIKLEIESRSLKDLPPASYDVGTATATAAGAPQPKKTKEEEKKL